MRYSTVYRYMSHKLLKSQLMSRLENSHHRTSNTFNHSMAPVYSKIPVAPFPGITLVSGLRCGHKGCFALFSSQDDSEEHAAMAHNGNVLAETCTIYEGCSSSGEVKLYHVVDESGEHCKTYVSGMKLTHTHQKKAKSAPRPQRPTSRPS
jgi:hypothetical protein